MINTARRASRNEDKVLKLEQAIFEWRSRHVILVLTLTYKPEWQHEITLDTIRRHRDQLLNNRRCNELLRGIDGYVWKIEEGHDAGGLHLHVVIFYNGNHRADIHIARQIGEYWENVVTHGAGTYWNSNANKEHHERYGHGDGTGQIDRHNFMKREALRKNLCYLAKDEQLVSKGDNPHLRMFGASMLPR